ncbi:MAG: 2-C-methyl-D-erythritol 4-phosphate cytidylyltransferase [Cyclobacteriaceae bacterium]
MKKYALIVAGGVGTRMAVDTPKQFIPVAGLPILMHTLTRFYKYEHQMEIILVLPTSHFSTWTNLSLQYDFDVPHRLVAGGSERFHSVKNGLDSIEGDGLVAIHDGVRPLIDEGTIDRCFKSAEKSGNGIASVDLKESIRHLKKGGNEALDRSEYQLIQTPQTFQVKLIKEAFDREYIDQFTDDASVAEAAGQKINLVEGSYRNLKVTTKDDLVVAEAFL